MSPIEARKAWARKFIQIAPEAPAYGTSEWLALPDGPEKVAAVVKAAECWLTELEDGLARLRAEHLGAALEEKNSLDSGYVEQRDEWRREWSQKSWRPHPANSREVA